MSGSWLGRERGELAADRILAAAERLFTERGIAATEMSQVAEAAGCSRATLYRYFDSKHALQVAYMHGRTHEVGRRVLEQVGRIDDPSARLVEAVLAALREVRETPALAAWFTRPEGGLTTELAGASPVVQSMCAAFLSDATDPDNQVRARWLVRILVSLLTAPAGDEAEERALIERFVAPVVLGPAPVVR